MAEVSYKRVSYKRSRLYFILNFMVIHLHNWLFRVQWSQVKHGSDLLFDTSAHTPGTQLHYRHNVTRGTTEEWGTAGEMWAHTTHCRHNTEKICTENYCCTDKMSTHTTLQEQHGDDFYRELLLCWWNINTHCTADSTLTVNIITENCWCIDETHTHTHTHTHTY